MGDARQIDFGGNTLVVDGVRVGATSSGRTTTFGIYSGTGAPSLVAAQGSIYLRTDGTNSTSRMYVNTTGAGTWANFTTSA